MADEAVSKDVLLYVADFLVDELSQNAATASDTKQRLRSYVDNLTAFIAARTPNGDVSQAKGAKRKDAGRADAEMPDAKVPATGKKPRQRTMQQLFLSYGAHSLPDRVREHKEKLLPNTNIIALMNKYSKSLARHELQQFEDDYKHFLDEFNEQLADGKIDMKVLAKRLTAYDHEQGIEMHPAFNGFMKFVDKEAGVAHDSDDLKDADAEPAEDETSAGEDEKPAAKTPPVAKPTSRAGKSPPSRAAPKPAAKAAAAKKGPAARAAAKPAPAKAKAGKAAKKPEPEVQAESSSGESTSEDDDDEEEDDE